MESVEFNKNLILEKKLIIPGNIISLEYNIVDGEKTHIQCCKGLIISTQNRDISKTFKIRQTIKGIIIDQIFFLNSPKIISISLIKEYKIRRSKLFFILKNKSHLIKAKIE